MIGSTKTFLVLINFIVDGDVNSVCCNVVCCTIIHESSSQT